MDRNTPVAAWAKFCKNLGQWRKSAVNKFTIMLRRTIRRREEGSSGTMARLPIGARIRDRRRERGLTQTALAAEAGISASYLNLIEHDKRAIGGALLRRIAEILEIEVGHLSGSDDTRLAQDLVELARSLGGEPLPESSALNFVARFPEWARAFVHLHRRYRESADSALALSDRLSQDPALVELSHAMLTQVTAIRSFAEILDSHGDLAPDERARFAGIVSAQSDELANSAREMLSLLGSTRGPVRSSTPREEVDDFIIAHGNHFPVLEQAADHLRAELTDAGANLAAAVDERLTRAHGLQLGIASDLQHPVLRDDRLLLPEGTPEASVRFLQARLLAERELGELLDSLIEDPRLTADESRAALARYTAGALRFPYEAMLETAEAMRYDVDRLGARFGGSFEQIAHRLVTLRRPGAAGIPFAFLRADPAGNLSKPFSISGLRMPRLGGTCPLWALHAAFAASDRPVTQLVEMPEGERYLFVARRVTKGTGPFGAPPVAFSVMLGCDAAYLDRIVYGDAFAGRAAQPTPVGVNCRSCRRSDCAQRAHPAILPGKPEPAAERDGPRRDGAGGEGAGGEGAGRDGTGREGAERQPLVAGSARQDSSWTQKTSILSQ
jgi:predicted transcriptional regulator/transcriptional regulator with XRE-family HTH domain